MGNGEDQQQETIIGPGGEAETVDADEVEARAKELGDSGEVHEDSSIDAAEPAVEEGPDVDETVKRIEEARRSRENIAERLDELARDLEDTPLFRGERDEGAQPFDLPGGRGWILPRTITPEEEREFDEIVSGSPRVRMKADGEGIDTIEPQVNRRARYQFLVEHAIAECELLRTNGHTEHFEPEAKAKHRREMRRILMNDIHPRFAEFIELKLMDYNGLTSAQRGGKDFT